MANLGKAVKGKNTKEKRKPAGKEGAAVRKTTFQTDLSKKMAELQRRLLRVG